MILLLIIEGIFRGNFLIDRNWLV